MTNTICKYFLASIMSLLVCSTTQAALINIDIELPASQIGITSYETSGFRFTANTGVFSMREFGGGGSQDYFYFGSTDPALPPGLPTSQVTIERIDGGLFDLVSFKEIADAAGIFGGPGIQTLTSNRGGEIDLYFDVSNPDRPLLTGATLPELFTGISKLQFNELQPSFAAYDFFVFNVTDIPEPGTLFLFIIGLWILTLRFSTKKPY